MKKVISFFLAVLIFTGSILGYKYSLNINVQNVNENIKDGIEGGYTLKDPRSLEIAKYDKESLLVLGSSEFSNVKEIGCDAFPTELLSKKNYGLKMVLMGQGGTQSLYHAISMVSLSDELKNKKAALIISPQWFTTDGISPESFASFFDSERYEKLLKDPMISEETKSKLISRTEELLQASGEQKTYNNMVRSREIFFDKTLNPIKVITQNIDSQFWKIRRAKEDYEYLESMQWNDKKLDDKETKLNINELLQKAQKNGEDSCTTNDYGIYDEYYETYIKDNIKKLEGSQKNESYSTSPEYEDLKLFLDVCKEKETDLMLISVPVNGAWYDYTEFPQNDREQYYENIRNIAKSYNVELADFTNKEYEKYFLRDVMHVGWKGWVYINEECYQFLNED